jgi:hypothetical protein
MRTDLAYWFFTPLITKPLTKGVTVVAVVVGALVLGREVGPLPFLTL